MGSEAEFQVTHDLTVSVLHQRLFFAIGGICKIFWLADQERQPLRRRRATNVIAKLVPVAMALFHIDQDEVVEGSSPPGTSFGDVSGAIDIHADLSHHLSTQLAFGL